MAADHHSEKVAHSMRVFGWWHKFTDAGWRNQAVKEMQQQEPGMADCILLPLRPYKAGRVFIEVKNGTGTSHERFGFSQWAERQRLFCVACAYSGIPYWMFLMMGRAINAKDYPLVAFLLPGEQMFELEWMAGGRKSLSYKTARTLLQPLTWVPGQDRWAIPADHPFQKVVRDNRHGHYPYYRGLRRDRQARRGTPVITPLPPLHPPGDPQGILELSTTNRQAIAQAFLIG